MGAKRKPGKNHRRGDWIFTAHAPPPERAQWR